MSPRLPALVLAVLLLSACSARRVPETAPGTSESEAEQRLARAGGEIDAVLVQAGLQFPDDALEQYLGTVAARVVRADAHRVSVRVLRDATMNAFALPNGSIWICAGLLAHVVDEAQLAFVLGHEVAHLRRRHAVAALRERSQTKLVTQLAGLVAAPIGLADPLASGLYASIVAGYGREREAEADLDAVGLVSAAGYSVDTVPTLFDGMDAVEDPSSGALYNDHPSNAARKAALADLVARQRTMSSGSLGVRRDAYRAATRNVAAESARLCVEGGNPRRALAEADARLAIDPTAARLHLLRGDALWRLTLGTTAEEGLMAATAAYERALTLDPSLADAHRGLGYVALSRGDKVTARKELEQYLQSGSYAADRRFIRTILARDLAP